jgi:hypothetical protein
VRQLIAAIRPRMLANKGSLLPGISQSFPAAGMKHHGFAVFPGGKPPDAAAETRCLPTL